MNNHPHQGAGAHHSRSTAPLAGILNSSWRGLGGWNYYFLLKFGLLGYGYLNFHPFANLVFLAFLLLPIANLRLHKLRQGLAIPAGLALFYYDTWLPGVNSILSQGDQLVGLSGSYVLELVQRFINWKMLGAALVLWVVYLFLAQWLRLTVWVVLALVWLNVQGMTGFTLSFTPNSLPLNTVALGQVSSVASSGGTDVSGAALMDNAALAPDAASLAPNYQQLAPTNQNINATLESFYQTEQQRQTKFPAALSSDAIPFDVLIINICSLSWSDMEAVNLTLHPLWQRFDIRLQQFNSGTSYSGPASLRLLRASCGQSSQPDLYKPAADQCYLLDNLAALGFGAELAMDHTGKFGNYLSELRQDGKLSAPLMSQQGLPNELVSFDGEPVLSDSALFSRWLTEREANSAERSATFFNLIPLHDGNRFAGSSQTAPYLGRALSLFDDLNGFFDALEKSGRKLMVVVLPEHGAALVGDKVQLSGLRDISSPSITHVPVGIKFFGMQAPHQGAPLDVQEPTSYLAISELIARSVDGRLFSTPEPDWTALVQNLPQTALVSENENALVMAFEGKNYIRLNKGDWVLYPN